LNAKDEVDHLELSGSKEKGRKNWKRTLQDILLLSDNRKEISKIGATMGV